MAIETYLFDLGGTLIDNGIYPRIYRPVMDMIKEFYGYSATTIDFMAEESGLKRHKDGRWVPGELCRILGLMDQYYKILGDAINPSAEDLDHIVNTFEELTNRGKQIGIVTNHFRKTTALYVEKYRLGPNVSFLYTRDEAGCKKNDPLFWGKLILHHVLDPKECLVVGDDYYEDSELPQKFGFQTKLVTGPKDLIGLL